MMAYAQPKIDELREQYVENIRNEVERSTIDRIQLKIETEATGSKKY